jgi:hypothetical protein
MKRGLMPLLSPRTVVAVAFALTSIGLAEFDGSAREQRRSTVSMEYNIDRLGADYASFELRTGDPEGCRQRCESEARCRAFTFVRPGIQGRYARCYLKTTVPQRRADRCCISGVKQ